MTERPGVYAIVHVGTGRVYVGSTSNLSKRWSRHRQELRDGTHRNAHLQAAWNLYGEDAFEWRVLVIIEPSERIWFEQRVIDAWKVTDPDRGFNGASIAGASYGGTGRIWTDEQRLKASETQKTIKPAQGPGAVCRHGHVKDGSYSVRRANGSIKIKCQECERTSARERQRRLRGIPTDHPIGKHYNRRRKVA